MNKSFIDEMDEWIDSLSNEQFIDSWNEVTKGMPDANVSDTEFFAQVKNDLINTKTKNKMKTLENQICNVSKMFKIFATAIARKESVKIEYLNDKGETKDFTLEINSDTPMFRFSINKYGYIEVTKNNTLIFGDDVCDIQSITTFRATKFQFK